jgi:hypothetical protein
MLYSGQSGHCKQDSLVRLEKTFVFQTSDFLALPAAYSFSLAKIKKLIHTSNEQIK